MSEEPKRKGGNPNMRKGAPSVNPRGKASGTRDKISKALLMDMECAWELYGIKALRKMAASDPSGFVKAYISLLPKEVKVDAAENMTEEQLLGRIRELAINLGVESSLLLAGALSADETKH
jgi:hypothetical protein